MAKLERINVPQYTLSLTEEERLALRSLLGGMNNPNIRASIAASSFGRDHVSEYERLVLDIYAALKN